MKTPDIIKFVGEIIMGILKKFWIGNIVEDGQL